MYVYVCVYIYTPTYVYHSTCVAIRGQLWGLVFSLYSMGSENSTQIARFNGNLVILLAPRPWFLFISSSPI